MKAAHQIPLNLEGVIDAVMKEFKNGVREPERISELYAWLEGDGIAQLSHDVGDQFAIKFGGIKQEFSDFNIRGDLEIPPNEQVTDAQRLGWARRRLEGVQSFDDPFLVASVCAFPITATSGKLAYIGSVVSVYGQNGNEFDWWGLWVTPEELYNAVGADEYYWVAPWMGEIPDEVILSSWDKS